MRRTVEEDLGGSGIVVPSLGDYGSPDSDSDPVRSPDDGRQRLLERDGGGCIFIVGDQLAAGVDSAAAAAGGVDATAAAAAGIIKIILTKIICFY